MRYSALPLKTKILALVMFFIIMGVWALAWGQIVSWIPEQFGGYVAVGLVCFGAGLWIGGDSAAREHKRHLQLIRRGRYDETTATDPE